MNFSYSAMLWYLDLRTSSGMGCVPDPDYTMRTSIGTARVCENRPEFSQTLLRESENRRRATFLDSVREARNFFATGHGLSPLAFMLVRQVW